MFKIYADNKISISRGDNAHFDLFINHGTKMHPSIFDLRSNFNSRVLFNIMKPNQEFDKATVKKVFTEDDVDQHGNVVVRLEREDTENLEEGQYYYEIKLIFYNGEKELVNTIVPKSIFLVEE